MYKKIIMVSFLYIAALHAMYYFGVLSLGMQFLTAGVLIVTTFALFISFVAVKKYQQFELMDLVPWLLIILLLYTY